MKYNVTGECDACCDACLVPCADAYRVKSACGALTCSSLGKALPCLSWCAQRRERMRADSNPLIGVMQYVSNEIERVSVAHRNSAPSTADALVRRAHDAKGVVVVLYKYIE